MASRVKSSTILPGISSTSPECRSLPPSRSEVGACCGVPASSALGRPKLSEQECRDQRAAAPDVCYGRGPTVLDLAATLDRNGHSFARTGHVQGQGRGGPQARRECDRRL